MERASTTELMDDLRNIMHKADELLRATAGETGEQAEEARRRIRSALESARSRLLAAQSSVAELSDDAMRATESYVRENPWQALAVAAGVGLILGSLLTRR
jgi:ElaB/YqjD/DUF883 family membrane-anchored ribosome-binding protein